MPTAQTCDALFALIERSGLLAADRLASYKHTHQSEGPNTAVELARALVRDRLLTPFQARQLLRGKYRGYFLTEKYKVLDQTGEGGMGQVFLCEHMLLNKLVAVKLLHASWVSVPGAEERFLREARAAAAIDHPNIVRVFDVDRAAGVPFMVMEYVDGKNLHQLVAEHGPLSPSRAAEYARQTAVGLHAAHKAGLVHRDVKPGNILLDRTGVVKVLDLGLVRFLVDSARNNNLTQKFDPGTVLGTLDFIAPEQADNSSTVDTRADIYSLGYTLYYLLTGKLPFGEGSAAQKLIWHQMRQPEPLSSVRQDVPPELHAVFAKMTAKLPAERYQTPAEVVAVLRPFVGVSVPPPAAGEMPKLRANVFQLGLSPPPTPEMLASSASDPHTPKASGAETALTPRAPARSNRPDEPSSDVLRSVTVGTADEGGLDLHIHTPLGTPSQTAMKLPRRSRWPLVAGIAAVLAVVVGLAIWQLSGPRGAQNRPNDPPVNPTPPDPGPKPVPPTGVVLTGEGSSFVDPMMQRWATAYRDKTGVTIQYAKTGSSAGVREFLSKRVLFAGTDAFLDDGQLREAQAVGGPVLHIPLVMGAVVATYNLPDVKEPLRFTGGVLADIYLDRITKWNDPAIEASNPGVKLPPLEITVVYRKDGSGTTFIWTDYLNKVSGAWKKPAGPGVGNLVAWPVGVGADKNDGVAREVSKKVGAIGYVELSFALAQNLSVGRVQNQDLQYVTPSLGSVTAAAAGKLKDIPADLRFTLTDPPGKESYPIAGTAWAVVFQKQVRDNKHLADFLHWAVHDGQTHVPELKYAPLPAELVQRIDVLLAKP